MTKVVINTRFGGFGLSEDAYKWLIDRGIPVVEYHNEPRNPETGLYDTEVPENKGRIIFDRTLGERSKIDDVMLRLAGTRYWDTWIDGSRDDPLVIECVEALGKKASGPHSDLEVIEVPDDAKWHIEEYDGNEHIAEDHRTWG